MYVFFIKLLLSYTKYFPRSLLYSSIRSVNSFLWLSKSFLSKKCESLYSGFSRARKFVVGVRATSNLLDVFKNSILNLLTVGPKDLTYVLGIGQSLSAGDTVIVFGFVVFFLFSYSFLPKISENSEKPTLSILSCTPMNLNFLKKLVLSLSWKIFVCKLTYFLMYELKRYLLY